MNPLHLTEIWLYPVKSLGGIRLQTAMVQEKGLVHDRRWMLVDASGVAMTQREFPKMTFFRLAVNGDRFIIQHRDPASGKKIHPSIELDPNRPALGTAFKAQVWNDVVEVIETDNTYSEWFSGLLGMPCKLVNFPESNSRPVDPSYSINHEQVSLADAYPFLIIGQGSLGELNSRLASPVPMTRFRPNFVFSGGAPFAEDSWRNFSIGANRFTAVKPCSRCVLTTVDPETGLKGTEPLSTLSTFRKKDNKIYFGQNVIARDHGRVSVGDPILPEVP